MAVTVSTSFAVLYGLFVALAVVSLYLLFRRGIRRPLSAIQVFAVTVLLMSTTIHWAVVVLHRFGSLLVNPGMDNETFYGQFAVEECVGTATLTINIVLSDLVVWWRVWVLWPESRVVRISGCVLLFATFVLSVVDTTFSCQAQEGFLFEGLAVGTAASALSLATNFTATVLTAYQAWLYRKSARDYAESGSINTRVEHILALLVESGALYCALWVVILVWQVGDDEGSIRAVIYAQHQHLSLSFWTEGGVLIEGCLVPLIAIYPTVIIVLVALNKSGIKNGFKRDIGGARPGGIAVAVETVVSTHSDLDAEDSPSEGTAGLGSFSHFGDPRRQGLDVSEKMAWQMMA
ncbi:hypothetical protein GSI_11349 [Ganoderma sinense ZZ0214-1]|uniref:Uncharacterized protein n=1 Tax=Ganoderma sinense ZZ0214-1 TaxID=1077348 RepID=A0A2G8RVR2_9APHY|nr:hypothetical protein GSI_11349 [Ganoderma sinense ZZ0214-1]